MALQKHTANCNKKDSSPADETPWPAAVSPLQRRRELTSDNRNSLSRRHNPAQGCADLFRSVNIAADGVIQSQISHLVAFFQIDARHRDIPSSCGLAFHCRHLYKQTKCHFCCLFIVSRLMTDFTRVIAKYASRVSKTPVARLKILVKITPSPPTHWHIFLISRHRLTLAPAGSQSDTPFLEYGLCSTSTSFAKTPAASPAP